MLVEAMFKRNFRDLVYKRRSVSHPPLASPKHHSLLKSQDYTSGCSILRRLPLPWIVYGPFPWKAAAVAVLFDTDSIGNQSSHTAATVGIASAKQVPRSL